MQELDRRRKQLIYRASHRGIKEMDIILGEFARAKIGDLDAAELDRFEALMEENDRDLFAWFTGEAAMPERHAGPLARSILDHCVNRFDQATE